jgi:hypothetical protein
MNKIDSSNKHVRASQSNIVIVESEDHGNGCGSKLRLDLYFCD